MFTTDKGLQMELPNDLKDYHAPLGVFQLIEPDRALFVLIVGSALLGFFFGGY